MMIRGAERMQVREIQCREYNGTPEKSIEEISCEKTRVSSATFLMHYATPSIRGQMRAADEFPVVKSRRL